MFGGIGTNLHTTVKSTPGLRALRLKISIIILSDVETATVLLALSASQTVEGMSTGHTQEVA